LSYHAFTDGQTGMDGRGVIACRKFNRNNSNMQVRCDMQLSRIISDKYHNKKPSCR